MHLKYTKKPDIINTGKLIDRRGLPIRGKLFRYFKIDSRKEIDLKIASPTHTK